MRRWRLRPPSRHANRSVCRIRPPLNRRRISLQKGERAVCTGEHFVVYNRPRNGNERASYNGSIEASQASDVGSIPIARSINPDDSIVLTPLTYQNSPEKRSEAIRKKLPDALSRPDLEMVALDYFPRLGHDNQRRLSQLYAWEEKKSKASWGDETVDYEKIAATAVQAMKSADLNRSSSSALSFPTCIAPATTRGNHLRRTRILLARQRDTSSIPQRSPQPFERNCQNQRRK